MRFVVHMDTWNDLTKGIKGNTYIDWISHIEKIVKCVLPVTSAFATSALRPWLCKIYPYIKATGPTGKGIALSDTQAFLFNEYIVELNPANFNILNQILN